MELNLIMAEFKNRLKIRGYTESTVNCYSGYLVYFMRYLAEHKITDMKAVNHELVLDYQTLIMAKPIAGETKALMIRPIKRLFEYLVETHQLLIDPTEGIVETSRKHRKICPVLGQEEIRKLLAQPNLSLRSQIRDRTILEVLYTSGVRLGELLALEVYHVDLKDQVLYIRRGKGKKDRVVPIGKQAGQYLREYLAKVRPHYVRKNPKERKLFLNDSGLPLNPGTVRAFFRKYRQSAGIKGSVSPHTFRRSCATHLLQEGADIRYVQQLLGHADIKTTQFYTKVLPVEIKRTHEKTHPRITCEREKVRT